ncbi:bifunctional HORMA domain superfamily/HORMA domain [Babesia duncani]|uniref:Bifunctional HORMA domain superfamily/HORMA domain n=1 Tax=Babesia duncani TaxID=323732 RepID=A0AAD9PNZ3_9APIC|nr:bifunctional HORMA domain superfamily/HORMA domain [Babesia duncani]
MENGISVMESTNVLKNFVKMGVSAISYLRNLFAEHVFEDATIGGLPLKRLKRSTPESTAILDWIDYGIYDALGKEYLKMLIVSIHDNSNVILESYNFTFQYHNNCEADNNCSLGLSVKSDFGNGGEIHEALSSIHKDDIKTQTITVLRDLVLLTQSLSPLPENRFVSMKLLYYEERVPEEYEPEFFKRATAMDHNLNEQINMEHNVGQLETGFHNMAIQVRSCCYVDESMTTHRTSTRKFDSQPNPTRSI